MPRSSKVIRLSEPARIRADQSNDAATSLDLSMQLSMHEAAKMLYEVCVTRHSPHVENSP